MEIRKNSWHFNLYTMSFSSGWGGETTNLCSYFWRVMSGMFKALFIIAFLLTVLAGLGSIIYQFPLVSLPALGLAAVCILIMRYRARVRNDVTSERYRTRSEGYEKPEPGLIRSYLKAKKDKVCPLITFVEKS